MSDHPLQIDSRVNPPRLVYHYTDLPGITGILADGLIRASPTRLYADLLMTRVVRDTEPLVWLSINPIMEMTTMVKLMLDHPSPIGKIHRIAIPYGYAGDVGLGDYTEAKKIPYSDWRWNVLTGDHAGSHYTTWRLVTRDIPRADWLGVERLAGVSAEDGLKWDPIEI
jgi:hypothetical protein